jgi:hypothetical protein
MVHGNGFEIVDKANGVALPIPAHDFFEHGHDVIIYRYVHRIFKVSKW